VRRKRPDIELGSHFSHFCAALGIPPTTGPRGSLPQLRDQLQRLFASTFQCIFHDESQGRHAGDGFLIAEKRELWWDPRPRKGETARGSHVVLSDRFYREATEAPVPLDLRVLRAFRSPFEIDIYVWLTWRFFRLRKPVTSRRHGRLPPRTRGLPGLGGDDRRSRAWQVWIQSGAYPLPRKLVITTMSDDARPEHTAVYTWNLAPSFNEAAFVFEPPAGAGRVLLGREE
jgi:hypothetical protein